MHDAKLTSLSKIEVGQTILVTAPVAVSGVGHVAGRQRTGKFRGFGRPKDTSAKPLTVTKKDHVPDEWSGKVWTLTLEDGTQTEGRYGTTHVYVTKDKPKTERKVVIDDDKKVRVVEVPADEPEWEPEVELDLAVSGTRRVRVEPGGTMRVQDWKGGEVTERTPKGRLVRIAPDGVLTILEDFPEDDAPVDHKPAVTDAEVASGDRCHGCKGYGVVRKTGSKAGKPYRTLVGAEESTAKGNSEKCPVCKGATLLIRTA